jgi:hypothetical protein
VWSFVSDDNFFTAHFVISSCVFQILFMTYQKGIFSSRLAGHTEGRLMRRTGLLTLCGVLLAVEVSAITGREWKQWSPEGRTTYVMGVTDAWQNVETVRRASNRAAADNAPHEAPSIFTPLINCMRQRMTYIQITATVDKYLENNPSQWHYDMASLVWTAMNEACTAIEQQGK